MKSDQLSKIGDICTKWWAKLYDIHNDGKFARRSEIAKLKRLSFVQAESGDVPDIVSALCIESYRTLSQDITEAVGHLLPNDEVKIFVIASILCRIKSNDSSVAFVASKLGGRDEDSRVLKEARFVRLMRIDNTSDLYAQMRRICALLRYDIPVRDFVESLWDWNDGSKTRQKWAKRYYGLFEDQQTPSVSD